MSKKRIAILGGGIAGVTLATELAKNQSFNIELIEKEDRLGGLIHSIEINGLNYDIGAFIFHEGSQIFKSFPSIRSSFVPINYLPLKIIDSGYIDKYPMSIEGYIRKHGRLNLIYACLDMAYCKIRYARPNDFISLVKYSMGNTIYRNSGTKNYIGHIYQAHDNEIDIKFAEKLSKLLARKTSIKNVIMKYLKPKPVISWGWLARSSDGFGKVFNLILSRLREQNVLVRLGCEVERIERINREYKIKFTGGCAMYDIVISTLPLEKACQYAGMEFLKKSEYVELFSLFYRFRGDLGHKGNILFNFSSRGRWKRITYFSQYYGKHKGEHYFTVEGNFLKQSENLKPESLLPLKEDFENHMKEIGLHRGELIYQGGLITQHAYPYYSKGFVKTVKSMKSDLTDAGIYTIGRQGGFDYIQSEEVAISAKRLVGEINNNLL